MDATAHLLSVARADSSNVLEFNPEFIMEEDLMSLSSKFPLIPGSQRSITFCTTMLSQKLREMSPDADFDLTDDCNPPPRYNVLHDLHLKEHFHNAAVRKRLIKKGFVTPSGYVRCTLLEFNLFRQWIRKLKLDRIYQERRRQRKLEKQKWKEKLAREQLLRDTELYCIVREREQKAREHKERGIKRRETERRKYLKLQQMDIKRREKFDMEIKRKKDIKESQREKNLERRKAQKLEDEEKMKNFKIGLLLKRSLEDKRREIMLRQRKQTLIEEKEQKLKETWKRRCSLSLKRQEEKRRQEKAEQEERIRNVAHRTLLVEQQRRKNKVYHDQCLNKRRNTLEKRHKKAQIFLDKLREKKVKDLELWKQKHQRMRERHAQQERRISLRKRSRDVDQEHRRRSRISSVWDLQSSLKTEFGIDDNVVYSGVVFAGRTATHRTSVQLEELAEKETARQVEEVDQFERLLSRLEAEFALREHVHYIVFGIISNAHDVLDLQERLEIARGVPSYVQRVVDAAERILAAQKIVANVVTGAKDEVQRKATLGSQRALAEDISENLYECAKDIVTVAIVSALRHNKDDREVVAARCLAADAVQAAKASLERLYGVKFEIEVDTEQMLSSLDKCAKEVATVAIISATRSLEMAIRKDDLSVIAARSLARDAVAAAKASLEKLPGVYVELEDEGRDSSMDIFTCLVKSARHVAQGIFTSGKDSLEKLAAQSLTSDAVQAAIASIENLYGIKIDSEDKSEQTAKEIAAAAVFSATGSVAKDSKISEVDLAVAARGLASSALDSVKASIEMYKQNTPRVFANLDEAAKHIAEVAVDLATRSLERIAEKNEWDLTFTTRKLVNDVLDSAKASLERLYGIKIDPDVELIPSFQGMSIISSTSVSLGSILSTEEHDEELRIASRNLASEAIKSAEASLERLHCIVNEMESNIKNTALDISKSLVDSSRNLLQHLEKEGLEIAVRDLACSAIESIAKSTPKLYEEESSVHDIVGSDSRLLNAAAKVTTISARASLGDLFDRGFIGGVELEEATGYLATHALISAEAMLEKVRDSSATMDLDLEICKAASELASHAVISDEESVAPFAQENQPSSSKPGSDHGTLFGKVTMYVEGLINGALRNLGSAGYCGDINDHLEQYEVISYDQACIADAEYSPHISVTTNELYKREIIALKAWRIVHDVLGNAMYIVKAREANKAFFSSAEVRPGNTRFARRRRSSVHFNRDSYVRRDSYVPRETDFLSVAKRPPTPHYRKGRAGTVVSQEIQELEKELAIPSDTDLNALNASDSDFVQRRTSDPGPRITSEDGSRSEPQRSASDLKIDSGDQETSPTEKISVYEIIKKREGTASCEISPSGSYVVLPHLNPSECSLIAARVESYEVLSNQTKKNTSVTSLPSLSPKGSFVASEAVEQVRQRKESQDRSVPSSSCLPDITSSSSKLAKGSSSTRSLKQSPEHPKRTSSLQSKKSSPKPSSIPSPKPSKESATLSCKSSVEKGPVGKVTASSQTSLCRKGGLRRSSLENVTAVSPKASVKDARHSQLAPGTKNGNTFSPSYSDSLTRTSLSPRASSEKATLSKPTSSQNQLKSSPKTSILFARASTETTMPSLDKTTASPRVSADKMSCESNRKAKDNVASSPRASREKITLTPKTSKGKVTPSLRTSTDKATMPLRTDKGTVTLSPRSSTENALLPPGVSNGKVTRSPRASTENTALYPRVSKGKLTQSPCTSTENAALGPRLSKSKVKQSPSVSSENSALTPSVSNSKVTSSPRASTENAALSARDSKEKVMQSSRMPVEDMAISSHSSKEKVLVSSRASTHTTTAPSGSTVKITSEVGKGDDKASARRIEEEKYVSTEKGIAIFPKKVNTTPSGFLDLQNVMENTDKTKMAVKDSTDLSSGTKFGKAVDGKVEQYQESEIASGQCVPQRTDVFQQQGVDLELDRHDLNKDRTPGDAEETKEVQINKNLKNLVPSLERNIQEKRLTPEGAEAETRPASSVDVLASKRYTDSAGLQSNIPVKQAPSENVKPSLSKSPSIATDSTAEGKISEQGSCKYSQNMTLSKASDEEKTVTLRKKPEGQHTSKGQDVLPNVGSFSPEGKGEKRESVSKMPDASAPEIKHIPDANQQFISSPRDVNEIQGYPTYRKVSISQSIHDTVDDIVQRMLSTVDEPSAVEASSFSGRGSSEEIKRDSKMNIDAPRTFGRGRRLPISKVSKSVTDTVDFMLQSVSASDERNPHQSSERTFSGTNIPPGYDVPRTASSMQRVSNRTSYAQQGISCVYGINPSPPKQLSPKRSRLMATSSQDSLEVRVTQSDSSILSSSSNKAVDPKPKVSGAWLDDVTVVDTDASVRSQSPKRPHSSPSSSLHRRSSGRLSVRHSLEGVSMETDTTLGKAT